MQRRFRAGPEPGRGPGERLPGSGGRAWPVLGYLTAGAFAASALWDGPGGPDLALLAGCALIGGLVYVVLQRPAASVDPEALHLRGMLSTVHIPLAAVERVAVSRFLAVFAGERRYVSTAVQRSLSAVARRPRPGRGRGEDPDAERVSESDLVERRISQLAEEARVRAGVRLLSDEQLSLAAGVHRTWSAPTLALLAVPAALLVLVVALG